MEGLGRLGFRVKGLRFRGLKPTVEAQNLEHPNSLNS